MSPTGSIGRVGPGLGRLGSRTLLEWAVGDAHVRCGLRSRIRSTPRLGGGEGDFREFYPDRPLPQRTAELPSPIDSRWQFRKSKVLTHIDFKSPAAEALSAIRREQPKRRS